MVETLHFSIKMNGNLREIVRREDGSCYLRTAQRSPSGFLKHKGIMELEPGLAELMADMADRHRERNPGEYTQ